MTDEQIMELIERLNGKAQEAVESLGHLGVTQNMILEYEAVEALHSLLGEREILRAALKPFVEECDCLKGRRDPSQCSKPTRTAAPT